MLPALANLLGSLAVTARIRARNLRVEIDHGLFVAKLLLFVYFSIFYLWKCFMPILPIWACIYIIHASMFIILFHLNQNVLFVDLLFSTYYLVWFTSSYIRSWLIVFNLNKVASYVFIVSMKNSFITSHNTISTTLWTFWCDWCNETNKASVIGWKKRVKLNSNIQSLPSTD